MLPLSLTLALAAGGTPALHVAYADPALFTQANLTPPTITYCTPLALRDYELIIGRTALIRPQPGCKRGSLIRKVSDSSGAPFDQQFVPLPQGYDYTLPRVFLFRSHLEYTLDGVRWNYLGLYP